MAGLQRGSPVSHSFHLLFGSAFLLAYGYRLFYRNTMLQLRFILPTGTTANHGYRDRGPVARDPSHTTVHAGPHTAVEHEF
ncbi:hypothetical protein Pla100_11660 [Neorhodopirellula pilleata]|uniref:Uncharacterized protein n=1 Tax=Neorhodopirellula pilleata TaxID=2714738 RepID=A0A5C6AQD9_9BACT|nr:hypothetical protein Pla100_11660 [Neorhodopirellula pilleata]